MHCKSSRHIIADGMVYISLRIACNYNKRAAVRLEYADTHYTPQSTRSYFNQDLYPIRLINSHMH